MIKDFKGSKGDLQFLSTPQNWSFYGVSANYAVSDMWKWPQRDTMGHRGAATIGETGFIYYTTHVPGNWPLKHARSTYMSDGCIKQDQFRAIMQFLFMLKGGGRAIKSYLCFMFDIERDIWKYSRLQSNWIYLSWKNNCRISDGLADFSWPPPPLSSHWLLSVRQPVWRCSLRVYPKKGDKMGLGWHKREFFNYVQLF